MRLVIIMHLKIVIIVFLFGIIPAYNSVAGSSPSRVIDEFHEALLSVMKKSKTLSGRERYKKLEPALDRAFKFDFMIKLATGSAWRKASKKDKSDLTQAFRRMSIATYAYRFKGYSGQQFHTIKATPSVRKTNLVFTQIVLPKINKEDEIIKLTYVIKQFGEVWKIIDILLDGGISELSVKYSEYRATLKTNGPSSLAQKLNKKADELIMD